MLQTWEMIIFVSFDFPSIILYIFVIHQLLWNNTFRSSFFRIATFMGVVDLSNNISIWLFMKLILWPGTSQLYIGIEKIPAIIPLLMFLVFYFTKVLELLLLSTTVNRFTAICYPFKQKKIWSTYLIPVIAFCFIFPLFITSHLFTGRGEILPFLENSADSYVLDVKGTINPISNALINAVTTSTVSLISLLFNIISLTTLYFRTKNSIIRSNNNKIPHKSEINLFIISCIDFIFDCMAVAQQVYTYSFIIREVYYDPVFDRLYLIYPWIYDLINLSRPYLLIFMCEEMRNVFLQFFKPKIRVTHIAASARESMSAF